MEKWQQEYLNKLNGKTVKREVVIQEREHTLMDKVGELRDFYEEGYEAVKAKTITNSYKEPKHILLLRKSGEVIRINLVCDGRRILSYTIESLGEDESKFM
jgi:hypothetical protein